MFWVLITWDRYDSRTSTVKFTWARSESLKRLHETGMRLQIGMNVRLHEGCRKFFYFSFLVCFIMPFNGKCSTANKNTTESDKKRANYSVSLLITRNSEYNLTRSPSKSRPLSSYSIFDASSASIKSSTIISLKIQRVWFSLDAFLLSAILEWSNNSLVNAQNNDIRPDTAAKWVRMLCRFVIRAWIDYECSTSIAKFTPVTTMFFLLNKICDGGSSKVPFLKATTLSILIWAYPRETKTNNGNYTNAAILPSEVAYRRRACALILPLSHQTGLKWVRVYIVPQSDLTSDRSESFVSVEQPEWVKPAWDDFSDRLHVNSNKHLYGDRSELSRTGLMQVNRTQAITHPRRPRGTEWGRRRSQNGREKIRWAKVRKLLFFLRTFGSSNFFPLVLTSSSAPLSGPGSPRNAITRKQRKFL